MGFDAELELLRATGLDAHKLESGCCGLAGSRRKRGGSRCAPTPLGVPVTTTSPGSRVMNVVRNAISRGTEKTSIRSARAARARR